MSSTLAPLEVSSHKAGAVRRWGAYVALLLVIAGTMTVRLRLLAMPLERDEGEYAYAGQLILRGIPPYQRLYNMKWPGTYYSFAALEGLFGQTIQGVRLGVMLVNIAQIVLVFMIARRLFDDWSAVVGAAAFAFFSISPSTLAFAGHATHFVVLAALAAIVCLQQAMARQRTWLYVFAGFFAGLAPIMKQPGIVFTGFVAACSLWTVFRAGRDVRWKLKTGTALLAGLATPALLMLASLWASATLSPFWLWTITYARNYGTPVTWKELPAAFFGGAMDAMGYECLLWLVAGFGLIAVTLYPQTRAAAAFLAGLALFSIAGVFPGTVFRPHYFILVFPAAALLVAAAVFIGSRFLQSRLPHAAVMLPTLLVAIPIFFAVWEQRDFYLKMTPDEACRFVYPMNPFIESWKSSDYLQKHSHPDDTIAVLGSEPEIYFYAHRLSATGYIYMYPMVEKQPYAHQFQLQMIQEIETARPKFVVFVRAANSWLAAPGSDPTLMKWFGRYRNENLKSVAEFGTDPNRRLVIYEAISSS